jgi:hypothetical protein
MKYARTSSCDVFLGEFIFSMGHVFEEERANMLREMETKEIWEDICAYRRFPTKDLRLWRDILVERLAAGDDGAARAIARIDWLLAEP